MCVDEQSFMCRGAFRASVLGAGRVLATSRTRQLRGRSEFLGANPLQGQCRGALTDVPRLRRLRLRPMGRAAFALLACGSAFAAPAAGNTHIVTLRLAIAQHGTVRTPHPPPGDAGDVFTTTLLLNNTRAALRRGPGAPV